MEFGNIKDEVNESIERLLFDNFQQATAKQLAEVRKRLDPRAVPGRLWYSGDTLVVPGGSLRLLNYYGGFEYVRKDCVYTAGDFTFFSSEDGRVGEVLEILNDSESDDDRYEE